MYFTKIIPRGSVKSLSIEEKPDGGFTYETMVKIRDF